MTYLEKLASHPNCPSPQAQGQATPREMLQGDRLAGYLPGAAEMYGYDHGSQANAAGVGCHGGEYDHGVFTPVVKLILIHPMLPAHISRQYEPILNLLRSTWFDI